MDEATLHRNFEETLGVNRAMRLMGIWNDSYPTGTKYDKTFKTGFYHSKQDNFISKAKSNGYTESEITMFLELS